MEQTNNLSIQNFGKLQAILESKGTKITYNWVLANAVLFDEPTLGVKGKLSFWDYDLE